MPILYPPAFGGRPTPEQRRTYAQSGNYKNGRFTNQVPTSLAMDGKTMLSLLRDFLKGAPDRKPAAELPVARAEHLPLREGEARVTWFGHSALLLELDGKRLLLDPMFGTSPSPFPALGGQRFRGQSTADVATIAPVDAVLISHDHYDHLDHGSIQKLRGKVRRFFVPLGTASHLERWGVDPAHIEEHDWWSETRFEGLTFACTPARHFSGRGLTNRNSTLWCSWVIAGQTTRIFFSGDSGYAPHFRAIGQRYGPFDLTLMECGQYDPRWAAVHMMPEETVQAHLDVGGKLLIPIHWGAFTLSLHAWNDPVERATKAAAERGAAIATPLIGQPVLIGSAAYPTAPWWR